LKKILLLDGFNLTFRAYYGMPELTRQDGFSTNALHGWLRTIWKLEDNEQPCTIAAFFDTGGSEKREQLLEDYKGNRSETPEDLKAQIPIIKQMTTLMGISTHECTGVEADDLIASAVETVQGKVAETIIVSADKDLAQLVGPGVTQLLPPPTARPSLGWRKLNADAVEEKFGVRPNQIAEYLALVGDTSDNIPGLKGVGPKTASAWLQKYKTLQGIFDNSGRLNPKRFQGVVYESMDLLRRNLELTLLEKDHPLENLGTAAVQLEELCQLLAEMEMANSIRTARQRYEA
jgi:DNA polymerase-1